jgi:trehalose synthase
MPRTLDAYRDIVGDRVIDRIFEDAAPLSEKHIVHVSSTLYGGGVAEILNSLVFLMNDAGVPTGWRVIKGTPDFFAVTKKFHNALQGAPIKLSRMKKHIYFEVNKRNASITHIQDHDCIVVHDVQPLPMIKFYRKSQPWLWRCHVDLSSPNPVLLGYLSEFIHNYDAVIISRKEFKCPTIKPCVVIHPSIDPLSQKNVGVRQQRMERFLKKRGIELDKPLIAQISRFDRWKNQLGVLKAFKLIKKYVDCRLVLLGNLADDDPEGAKVYNKVMDAARGLEDVNVLLENNDFLVNCLQRAADVVVQNSTKEGFGLVVSEALWKNTPVVARPAGGIPLQVIDGKTGYLVRSDMQLAKRVVKLLREPKLAKHMGKAGHEHVKRNFLITRHMLDYIALFKSKTVGLLDKKASS